MASKRSQDRPWEPLEVLFLRECTSMGISAVQCGRLLDRTKDSVASKRRDMGLVFWKPEPKPVPPPQPIIFMSDIQTKVARRFRVSEDYMMSDRRDREFVRPRQVAMFLSRKLARKSFAVIGRKFQRDHTTVCHAYRAISDLILRDEDIKKAVESVENELQSTNFPTIHRPETCGWADSESINYPMEHTDILEAA